MAAMAESGAKLAGSENAPDAQQKAIDKLGEAEQAIANEIANLEAAAEELAQIEELLEKLEPHH